MTTERINIPKIRDENSDSDYLVHADVRVFDERLGKYRYEHAPDCPLCALLDVAEAAHNLAPLLACQCATAWTLRGLHAPGCLHDDAEDLSKALNRFDFSE